ncbi:MAG TPA: hypothetical protein VFS75_01800 [Candidatus Paceibacterota bacterium]|nr:hypothetical protein [Candidatus Paceibacterota bacterium]
MAYKTYITNALVCAGFDSHSADRSFLLFTREAGMLFASAKGVRKEISKHRYALQECSEARVTLVRGKAGWRVTGAEPVRNFYAMARTREARALLKNAILLIRRVMHGETPHAGVFDDVIASFERMHDHRYETLGSVLSLRVLHALGYIAPSPEYDLFLSPTFPFSAVGDLKDETAEALERAVERALVESHL